jgi:hypothetical protein
MEKLCVSIDLNEYYDSEYSETNSECSNSEDETEDEEVNNMPRPMLHSHLFDLRHILFTTLTN